MLFPEKYGRKVVERTIELVEVRSNNHWLLSTFASMWHKAE